MRLFYSLLFFILLGVTAVQAQLPDYSVAPDWTSVDINGVQHNLYDNLDSGYAVLIDLSAAWCAPCWTLHEGGLLQDLHDMYGPEGTNEVRVFYIESESSNTIDQLHGIGTSGSGANRATDTEGDWVSDHTYPFIDDASIAQSYGLNAYPTSVFIGTDRLTQAFVGAPGPTVDLIYELAQNDAGPVIPGTDARLITYTGQSLSVCGQFTPSVLIQNHGSDTLTEANFTVWGDTTPIGTYTWTGSLLPYETVDITMDEVNGVGYSAYGVSIVEMDEDSTNNQIAIEGLTVIGENASGGVWDVENADPASLDLPDGMFADPASDFVPFAVNQGSFNGATGPVGGFGDSEFSIFFNFYQNTSGSSIMYLDKMDFSMMDNPRLTFNHAYRQYANENDRLIIEASNNCGQNWIRLFDAQGADLATLPAAQPFYIASANDWQSNEVDLSFFAGDEEVIVRFVGVTAYGNNLYIDDMAIMNVSGVNEIASIAQTNLYPNPTIDRSTLELTLTQSENVNIFVTDLLGRTVQQVFTGELLPGTNNIEIDAANLANGLYSVVIQNASQKASNTVNMQIQR